MRRRRRKNPWTRVRAKTKTKKKIRKNTTSYNEKTDMAPNNVMIKALFIVILSLEECVHLKYYLKTILTFSVVDAPSKGFATRKEVV